MNTNSLHLVATAILLTQDQLVHGQSQGSSDGNGTLTPADAGYFQGETYQSKTAQDKLDELWSQCEADNTVADQDWSLDNLFTQNMRESFFLPWDPKASDELPNGRVKINHAQGVVARVAWEDLGNHDYSGLYNGGSSLGLIRMSEGNFLLPEGEMPGLTPTLALKFLRDGERSANLLANTSFEPSNSFNFFANDFHTMIDLFHDECHQETIQAKFQEATGDPHSMGLADFARSNTAGQEVNADEISYPFNMWFEPSQDLKSRWPETRQFTGGREIPFYEQLQQIPNDYVMFEVWAQDLPNDPERFGKPPRVQHIADIRATSDVITSAFGDERLFFQHEFKHFDWNDNMFEHEYGLTEDEWREYVGTVNFSGKFNDFEMPFWPNDQETARTWVSDSIREYQCPFAWLLEGMSNPLFQ